MACSSSQDSSLVSAAVSVIFVPDMLPKTDEFLSSKGPSAQAALIYCSEMAVAEVRGFLAGIVGFIIGLGYAVTCTRLLYSLCEPGRDN